jgi:hypothetical protein
MRKTMVELRARRAAVSPHPDNPNLQDRETYRHWVRGLFAFYSIIVALALTISFARLPAQDRTASISGATRPIVTLSPNK